MKVCDRARERVRRIRWGYSVVMVRCVLLVIYCLVYIVYLYILYIDDDDDDDARCDLALAIAL